MSNVMVMNSYLRWLALYQPEYLEKLLGEDKLEDHLDEVLNRCLAYREKLAKQGLPNWQIDELEKEAIMPSNQPEPKRKLSRKAKELLFRFEHPDQEITE